MATSKGGIRVAACTVHLRLRRSTGCYQGKIHYHWGVPSTERGSVLGVATYFGRGALVDARSISRVWGV